MSWTNGVRGVTIRNQTPQSSDVSTFAELTSLTSPAKELVLFSLSIPRC